MSFVDSWSKWFPGKEKKSVNRVYVCLFEDSGSERFYHDSRI